MTIAIGGFISHNQGWISLLVGIFHNYNFKKLNISLIMSRITVTPLHLDSSKGLTSVCIKAGSLFYHAPQSGLCSFAPLTLPGRMLSRACVYFPVFVLKSSRPRRENTRNGRRVKRHSKEDQFPPAPP